jgi:uncharacterized membrane protein (UPF0127 family)
MPRLLVLATFFATLFVLAACANDTPAQEPPAAGETQETDAIPFRKDGTLDFIRDGEVILTLDIEIAEGDSARTRGMMQRTGLPDRSGMLFLFPVEEELNFWMSNTPISLDLLFVNADSQVVSISKYTQPFSTESIFSEAPAQYVIEVEAGFTDTRGLIESDRVSWRRVSAPGS